jgi:hypothetical protein
MKFSPNVRWPNTAARVKSTVTSLRLSLRFVPNYEKGYEATPDRSVRGADPTIVEARVIETMMNTGLIQSQANEEQALRQRREDLAALESQLAQRESGFATLQSEMRVFEGKYLGVVGARYDELAEIEKEIAGIQGLAFDDEAESDSLADDEVGCGLNRFHSDKLKKLYREVARKFHPDLAQCDQERRHRHQLMIEVNRAYESGAEARLQELLEAGASIQDFAGDSVMSAEMILLVRKIAAAKERLLAIESDIAEIMASETYKLKLRVENAEALGVDLFADLLAQVDRQIRKARNRLEHLAGPGRDAS